MQLNFGVRQRQRSWFAHSPRRPRSSCRDCFRLWITGFGVGALWFLLSPQTALYNGVRGAAPQGFGLLMVGGWLAGTALLLMLSWGLKRVRLRDNDLLISNYIREIAIPLSEVSSVHQRLFPNAGAITVEFRSPTRFGRRITFLPSGRRARWYGEEGTLFQELRDAVARASLKAPAA